MRFIFSGCMTAVTACLLACLAGGSTAHAQRTMKGQFRLDAGTDYAFTGPRDFGGHLSGGQYLLEGYWEVGLDGSLYTSAPLKEGYGIEHAHLSLQGGYMHRLVSTRNRRVSLYGGGNAFMGYEAYDPCDRLPGHVTTGLKDGSFLYGITPCIEMELFFCRRGAVVLRGDMPLNFSSPLGMLHFRLGAGVRFCL